MSNKYKAALLIIPLALVSIAATASADTTGGYGPQGGQPPMQGQMHMGGQMRGGPGTGGPMGRMHGTSTVMMRGPRGSSTAPWMRGSSTMPMPGMGGKGMMRPDGTNGVFGTVTAVSGTTLTVNSMMASSTATYTVDASAATVKSGRGTSTASTVSSIVVGDRVSVIGTVSGTSVTATTIFDMKAGMMGMRNGSSTYPGGPRGQGGLQNGGSQPKPGFFGRIGSFFKGIFGF